MSPTKGRRAAARASSWLARKSCTLIATASSLTGVRRAHSVTRRQVEDGRRGCAGV